MTKSLASLVPAPVAVCALAIAVAGLLGCGRTELNLCKAGVPCHLTPATCPGGDCDGGIQPDAGGQPDAPTTCGPSLEACGETCTDVRTDEANCGSCGNRCGAGQTCRSGSCGCTAPGQTSCDGACVLTATDPDHCGSCEHACGGGQACIAGSCVCPAGTVVCDGICRALDSDAQNCGACGNVCSGSAAFCQAGSCVGVCTAPTRPAVRAASI